MGDKQKEVQRNETGCFLHKGADCIQGSTTLRLHNSPCLTVCKKCQQSKHACLECTFGHQENFSKVSKTVIAVYCHLFFSFSVDSLCQHNRISCFKLNYILLSFIIQVGDHTYWYVFLKECCWSRLDADHSTSTLGTNMHVSEQPHMMRLALCWQLVQVGSRLAFHVLQLFRNPVVIIAINYEPLQI